MEKETWLIELPDSIALPMFDLFQRVQYNGKVATVTGVRWVGSVEALLIEMNKCWGWFYDLSFVHGFSPEEICENGLDRINEIYMLHESDLRDYNPSLQP